MLKRALIFLHRWLGVGLCLVFLVWFLSAIGMMYWEFPQVTDADRLARLPPLQPAAIRLSPAEAFARSGLASPPTAIRLASFDGRHLYRLQTRDGELAVYADTGDEQIEVPPDMRDRIAAAWAGRPVAEARAVPLVEVDQWTVQGQFQREGPLWKYSWPDGQQVYVSEATGEVVQYTTTASRIGAYLGPIPHWLYFTPLRKHGPRWSAVVIWSSALGTLTAILGLVIGVWMYSPSKRYRREGAPTAIPYRGMKRWHTAVGLVFGTGAVTWAFSGLLSMEPFPAARGAGRPDAGDARARLARLLRGPLDLRQFEAKPPRQALAELGAPVKQLELVVVAGEPAYLATLGGGDTRVVPIDSPPQAAFDSGRLMAALAGAVGASGGADLRVVDRYDRYYLDRRGRLPLPVILIAARDGDRARYYIDPKTARIVGAYSSRRWVARWLYHGLHSLDFPWLYAHRPLWDIVVIAFMLGGAALSVTSLVLAWRVVFRRLAAD